MSETGNFLGCEMEYADWIVDPGLSDVSELDHMICISGDWSDPEGSSLSYSIYLRPWGMDWEDVKTADTTYMPYDDMMPLYYEDWYLPKIKAGEEMPESFGMYE